MKKNKWLPKTALTLSAVGAINWGLNEIGFNLVGKIFGSFGALASVVYYLIAVCGVYALYRIFK